MIIQRLLAICATIVFCSLSLSSQSLYQNDHCDQASLIAVDSTIRVSIGLPCLDATNCSSDFSTSLGIWYKVTGSDEIMEINTLADHDDNVFFHVFEGDCTSLHCVSDGAQRFYAVAGKEYYILVAKPVYDYGQDIAHFVITSQTPAPYDQCENAMVLACDSTYQIHPRLLTVDSVYGGCSESTAMGWLYLEGDGQIKKIDFAAGFFNEISYQVFENQCGNLQCVYRGEGSEFQLATVTGKDYYIGVTHENLDLNIPIEVRMSCRDNMLNTTCTNAVVLDCSDIENTVLTDSIPIDLASPQVGTFPGYWYALPKDSIQYQIRMTSPEIENLVIAIFKVKNGDCVNESTPYQYNPYPLGEHSYVVNVQPGESVFIKVAYFTQPTTFRLSVQCDDLENNLKCEDAIALDCDQFFKLYETSQGDFGDPKTGDDGLWFSIEGNDLPYELVSNGEGGSYRFDIFINDCDSLEKVKSVDLFISEPYGLLLDLPAGQTYYIKVYPLLYQFVRSEMWLSCNADPRTVLCEFGDTIVSNTSYDFTNNGIGINLQDDPCGTPEGIWFTFIGNDSIVEVETDFPFQSFSVYTGDCDSLICFGDKTQYSGFDNYRLLTEFGQSYYIKFYDLPLFVTRSFILKSLPRAINAVCGRADTIRCGEDVLMQFGETDSDFSDDCPGGHGLWYLLKGNDQLWRLQAAENTNFRIFENDCSASECFVSGEGYVQFFAEMDHTYFVKANSNLQTATNLSVECFDIGQNTCALSDTLVCGDTLSLDFSRLAMQPGKEDRGFNVMGQWYAFESEGNTLTIEHLNPTESALLFLEVRDELCDEVWYTGLVTLEEKPWVWYGDSGVVYKILIASSELQNVKLNINCIDTPQGSDCENALTISCDNPFAYSSVNRSLNPIYDLYGVQWMTFIGDGSVANVRLLDPSNGFGYAYRLFTTLSFCDSLELTKAQNGTAGSLYFPTENNKTYYLAIGLTNADQVAVDWTFELSCTPALSSSDCDQALSLECGTIHTASTLGQAPSIFGSCGPLTSGAWFTLEGDDLSYSIQVTNTYQYNHPVHVLLGDGDCNSLTCLQAEDLSSGVGELAFTALSGRDYYIKFEGHQGEEVPLFDFKISCKNQVENDSCTFAEQVVCGQQISASLSNLDTDASNPCNDTNAGLYYTITGNGQEIIFDFDIQQNDEFQLDIYENSCGIDGICLFQQVVDTFRNKIQFLTKDSTEYYFRVSSNNHPSNPFNLTLTCVSSPENEECSDAITLQCNDTVNISLITPLGFAGETPCHFTEDARVFWYELPKTDKVMSVKILNGQNASHYISLISGTCNQVICENVFDINSNQIVLNTEVDSTYYLAIHGDAASVNEFSFVLECLDQPDNDLCLNAQEIVCGDTIFTDLTLAEFTNYAQDGCVINPWKDIWYKVTGTGEIMELAFVSEHNFGGFVNLFLDGDCAALSCVQNGPWRNNTESDVYRFLTVEGQDYLISIQHPLGDSLDFTLRCTDQAQNDLCPGAFEWTFSDTTEVLVSGSFGDPSIPCYDGQQNGVWFTFEGDGGYVHFTAPDTTSSNMKFILLGGNCEDLQCLEQGSFSLGFELDFRTDINTSYYLLIYGSGGKIFSERGPVMDNVVCEQAVEVKCDDVVVLQSRLSLPDTSGSGCPQGDENTGWYQYTGTGDIVNFEFSSSGAKGSLEILLQCGDSCIYKHEIDTVDTEPLSFLGVEGVTYLLKLNIDRSMPDQLLLMEVGCAEGPVNYNMDHAVTLSCDTFSVESDKAYFNLLPECYSSDWVTYWYYFEGNDSLFRIVDSFPAGVTAVLVDENCHEIQQLTADSLSFETEDGQGYFLVVRHLLQDTIPAFSFGVEYQCIIIGTDDDNTSIGLLAASPNPFTDRINLEIYSQKDETVITELWDALGKKISRKPWHLHPGKNVMTVEDWIHLPAGMYVVSVKGKQSRSLVLIKQ